MPNEADAKCELVPFVRRLRRRRRLEDVGRGGGRVRGVVVPDRDRQSLLGSQWWTTGGRGGVTHAATAVGLGFKVLSRCFEVSTVICRHITHDATFKVSYNARCQM